MFNRLLNRTCKICALVAVASILPALAYAGGGGNNQGGNNQGGNNQGNSVPDGGPGIVLIATTVGAILVLSARQSSRKKQIPN
jgi:hypothetical protein